jgi:hypothetical protein
MTNEATTTEAAAVAEQGGQVAPEKATSTKAASQKKGAPKGQKTAKAAKQASTKKATSKPAAKKQAKPASKKAASKKAAKATAEAKAPREGSKKQIILDLLRRKHGATLAEIMEQTGWKAPSVRGFISKSLRNDMGLAVESTKSEAGGQTYRIGK